MCNLYTKFVSFLEICKKFSNGLVTDAGNFHRPGPVPRFSDLEIIALSMAAESEGIDSENWQFEAKLKECRSLIPHLISRRQFSDRRKKVGSLQEQIRSRMAMEMDGGENYFCIDSKPTEVCRVARGKRCKMGKTGTFENGARFWILCLTRNTLLWLQASCTLWIEWCHSLLRPFQGKRTRYQLHQGCQAYLS